MRKCIRRRKTDDDQPAPVFHSFVLRQRRPDSVAIHFFPCEEVPATVIRAAITEDFPLSLDSQHAMTGPSPVAEEAITGSRAPSANFRDSPVLALCTRVIWSIFEAAFNVGRVVVLPLIVGQGTSIAGLTKSPNKQEGQQDSDLHGISNRKRL